MNKASATSLPKPDKTEKMLLIAKNYWDYTTQPIAFVAPTMLIAVNIRNRFFRLVSDRPTATIDIYRSVRVRCLSLCEPDGPKGLSGKRDTAFFFDHACFERQDLFEAAVKMANVIWENRLGEVIQKNGEPAFGFTLKISDPDTIRALENATKENGGATVPCPWGRENGPERLLSLKECEMLSVDLKPRHEVDKQRTASILQAMIRYARAEKAIPEEWMDELNDLAWRERDRLEGNNA